MFAILELDFRKWRGHPSWAYPPKTDILVWPSLERVPIWFQKSQSRLWNKVDVDGDDDDDDDDDEQVSSRQAKPRLLLWTNPLQL